MSWADTGRLASLMGARKIEHRGTQNHRFGLESLAEQFEEAFGYSLNV
jgi:adenosine kinase